MKETARALAWIEEMATLEKELGKLEKKQQTFEERRQGFALEARKLEKARKALGLEGDYRSVTVVRELQARETDELQSALAVLPEKEKAGAEAHAARSAAEGLLNEARTRQLSEGEVIKKVRDFDVRLDEQSKLFAEKTKAIAESEKQAKTYRNHVERNEKELKRFTPPWKCSRNTGQGMPLMPCSRPISAPSKGVLRGSGLLKQNTQRPWMSFPRRPGKKESVLAEAAGKEADHEKARLEFEKKQTELKNLADEVTALLQGRDIGQWRMDVDAFKERERLLVQTGETVARTDRGRTG